MKRTREQQLKKKSAAPVAAVIAEPTPVEEASIGFGSTADETAAASTSSLSVYSSQAPSAHAIGIAALATNPKENRLVVALEDGTLSISKVIPIAARFTAAITPLVRTGSNDGRTVTRILYALGGSVIVASYLSGQIVVYDAVTLAPLHVAERVGGAIWDMISLRCDATATEEELVAACADGSWYHFVLSRKQGAAISINLFQVFPKVVGAHRALTVALCGTMLVGSDDCGNVVAWQVLEKGVRGYNQLWLARLPKGAYAKTITYDKETDYVVVGTSLGDVGFLTGAKGDMVSLYTNHQGPITSVISAGPRTVLATGWHESLRAYRFVEGKWIPSEVRRRTHYHEATQLVHLTSAGAVIGASRDGTILIASLNDNFSSPPKYVQPCPQAYAYAAAAGVVLTVAGTRVEMYQGNEAMSHWAPLAVYTAHGGHGIRGIWCDANLTRIVIATTTRVVILGAKRKSTSSIALSKIADYSYANAHAAVLVNDDCYIIHDGNTLTHISFGGASIESHMAELPLKPTSLGMIEDGKALVLASAADETNAFRVPLNEDGSFGAMHAEAIPTLRLDTVSASVALGQYQGKFVDLSVETFKALPSTLPADTSFFAKIEHCEGAFGKTMWMGHCLRGLLFATNKTWWLADEDNRASKKPLDAGALNRSMNVAISQGPRTTFVAAFAGDAADKVLVLRRDIESEVETLPLMWKVRRFGN